MKLPPSTLIARQKATRYLLVPQARGDKSRFLARAGYTLDQPETLLTDIRDQILSLEARPLESNQFGQFYEIRGELVGPNDVSLHVRTIWMTEHLSGRTRFVTLMPDSESDEV
jgi:hypothetical protein